jgi:hypothetical protein
MRRGGRALLGLLVLMSGPAAIAMTATPAVAGATSQLTVTKAVDGTAPPDAQFVVDIDCGSSTELPNQMTFTGPGSQTATIIFAGPDATCTVVESVTAGASVTYACEVTSGNASCNDTTPNSVHYNAPFSAATITVTNTFLPAPAPSPEPGVGVRAGNPAAAPPAEAVAGAARFTG